MVLQKLWVSQSGFCSCYVRLALSFFFLYQGVSESRFFARLRVSKSRFVCLFVLMTPSRHLILNLIKVTFNFGEKVTPNFS